MDYGCRCVNWYVRDVITQIQTQDYYLYAISNLGCEGGGGGGGMEARQEFINTNTGITDVLTAGP